MKPDTPTDDKAHWPDPISQVCDEITADYRKKREELKHKILNRLLAQAKHRKSRYSATYEKFLEPVMKPEE